VIARYRTGTAGRKMPQPKCRPTGVKAADPAETTRAPGAVRQQNQLSAAALAELNDQFLPWQLARRRKKSPCMQRRSPNHAAPRLPDPIGRPRRRGAMVALRHTAERDGATRRVEAR